jgi:hypothetical protein
MYVYVDPIQFSSSCERSPVFDAMASLDELSDVPEEELSPAERQALFRREASQFPVAAPLTAPEEELEAIPRVMLVGTPFVPSRREATRLSSSRKPRPTVGPITEGSSIRSDTTGAAVFVFAVATTSDNR